MLTERRVDIKNPSPFLHGFHASDVDSNHVSLCHGYWFQFFVWIQWTPKEDSKKGRVSFDTMCTLLSVTQSICSCFVFHLLHVKTLERHKPLNNFLLQSTFIWLLVNNAKKETTKRWRLRLRENTSKMSFYDLKANKLDGTEVSKLVNLLCNIF